LADKPVIQNEALGLQHINMKFLIWY